MSALPFDAEGTDYPESMLARKFGREVVNYFAGTWLPLAPLAPLATWRPPPLPDTPPLPC